METFLIRAAQFVVAISLLVILHEGGHFFFAKLFGIRVEKFYLFFDVTIGRWKGSLMKFKPKNSHTQYGIGWLPLGGYCKISGMIDESMDKEQMKQPPQPWEFRTHPAWQRLLVMLGGVMVNFVVALFIYAMVLFAWGQSYVETKNMTMGMKFSPAAQQLGFHDHDILLAFDGKPFKTFETDLFRQISTAQEVTVLRQGKQVKISLPGDLNLLDMIKTSPVFVRPFTPSVVDSVVAATPAAAIGMLKGDTIKAFNGTAVDSYNEFAELIGRLQDRMTEAKSPKDSLKLRQATIIVAHKGAAKADTLAVTLTPDLKLGFSPVNVMAQYEPTKVEYGFFESLPAGVAYGWKVLSGYVSDLKYVFTADGAKSLGGFGAIGSMFPPQWDWHAFWMLTAFLSIMLGFMNALPIPALDGGYAFLLIFEMLFGWTPSEKFMERAITIGFVLLLMLMAVANINDVLRWIGVM